MTDYQLTRCWGELLRAHGDPHIEEALKMKYPVITMQCIRAKDTIGSDGSYTNLRMSCSDGEFWSVVLYINHAEKLTMEPLSIIQLSEWKIHMINQNRNKLVLMAHAVRIVGPAERIGDPRPLPLVMDADATSLAATPHTPSNEPVVQGRQPVEHAERASPATRTGSRSSYSAILPIEGLSPYHNTWTIRARVANKSDVRHWHNQRGEGKLFSVTFIDESGEIRATGFGDQVDKFFDLLQEGQVYYVTKCRVNMAKKQFSNVQNDFELMFEKDTSIELCTDKVDVPQVKFNFTEIDKLANAENGGHVDLLGVLKDIYEVNQITSKTTGRPYDKRDILLVDRSNYSIRCTLWGKTATSFNIPLDSVLAFKGAKIADFNGRNLSALNSTTITTNPDIPEAHGLKGWYDAQGRTGTFAALQAPGGGPISAGGDRDETRKQIQDVLNEQLGMSEKPDYFTVKASLYYIKKDGLTYPSCTQENCIKKVIVETDGQWRCEKCQVSMPQPNYRYAVSINIADPSGQLWASCFDDVGNIILGKSANEINELQSTGELDVVLSAAMYKDYVFRCRARQDNYNDQVGIRYQILRATPVDFATESTNLLKVIAQY
jgi:replication factor A1